MYRSTYICSDNEGVEFFLFRLSKYSLIIFRFMEVEVSKDV